MTEENDKRKSDHGEGGVRNHVSSDRPGSEFETRELPAIRDAGEGDDEAPPDGGDSEIVDADRPGSEFDTVVETGDAEGGPEEPAVFEPVDEEVSDEDETRSAARHPFDEDDLETRQVPALKEEWRERANQAAEALGEPAEFVGPFEGDDEGDPALAASVAAASGELPLPREDEPAEIAGPILHKAREAQEYWARLRFEERLGHFRSMQQEMVDQRNDHVPSMATSTGRPMVETLTGEYLPVLEALSSLEDVVPPLLVERHTGTPPWTHEGLSGSTRMVPWGVIVIVNDSHSPFGFPMTLAIDALATGNAVVICGSESHPRVNEIMRRLFHRARLPEGLAQVLSGNSETLRAIVDQRPDKLVLEGSEELATRVAAACAVSDCEFQYVRAAKNMLVVLDSADVDYAVAGALYASFHSGGMVHGVVDRLVVQADLYDEFRMKFIEAIREMNSHHAQLAHIKDSFNAHAAAQLIEDAVAGGARVTYPAGEEPGRWIHWKAVVVESLSPKARLSREPFEGPGVVLYRAKDPIATTRKLLELAPANNLSILGEPTREQMRDLDEMPVSRLSIGEPLVSGSGTTGGGPTGSEVPRSHSNPIAMLRARVKNVSRQPRRRIAWFPYTDDKAYAMMDAMEWMYGAHAGKRVRGALKLALNATLRRLLKGGE